MSYPTSRCLALEAQRSCGTLTAGEHLCRYEGEWVDDMMTGRGFMVWADGRRYDGEWYENRCNGRGVLTYKDGRRYEVL